MKIRVTLNA